MNWFTVSVFLLIVQCTVLRNITGQFQVTFKAVNDTLDHVESRANETASTVEKKITVSAKVHHHTKNPVCALYDNKSLRPVRILISSTDKYIAIFLNWLIFFHNVCGSTDSIYFVCLDKEIENRLPHVGFTCSHVHHLPPVHTNNRLWLLRARITKGLLEQGFDVLMTDSDALWLRNPFLMLAKFPGSDVIASRASFPEEISAKIGATACMGFIYIKANSRTVVMWDELYNYMVKVPRSDDQRDLNQLLLNSGIRFDPKPTFLRNKVPNTGSFQVKGLPLTLTLLPHNLFMRMCDSRRKGDTLQSTVAHCISQSKSEGTKVFSEKMYGLWALRDKWNEVAFSDMDSFVESISSHNVSHSLLQHPVHKERTTNASQTPS